MAVLKLKDGRWIFYHRDGDRIVREYFGRGPDGEAAANRRNVEMGFGDKPIKPGGVAFRDLAKEYLRNKALSFSANSTKHLQIRLKANILPAIGNKMAIALTDTDMDNYVRRRRKAGVKFSTISRELTDVKAILNWSVARRPPLLEFNPVRDYKKPSTDDAVIQPPTKKEALSILKNASPHLRRAIKLSWYLGLRPGAVELLSLTWAAVNWEKKSIRVTSAEKGGPAWRDVPIHDDFFKEFYSWYQDDQKPAAKPKRERKRPPPELLIDQRPIIHYHGHAITKIQSSWKGALTRAGIARRLRPYDLRHYFVTTALEKGADVKAVAEIVGSRPETIIKHYQHVTRKVHREAVAKIPALDPET